MSTLKICLDAGHYGKYNRAPSVKEYYESDMTWKLHLLLKAELEKYGIIVTQTRNNKDTDKTLYNRGAASKGCDLFLSLHSNAVGSNANESVDYPLVITQLDGKGDALGEKLAKAVESLMGTAQKANLWKKEGKSGEYYGVLRGAAAVGTCGMIIEHSFHTCSKMAKWLLSEDNLKKLAVEEARIIAEHYGLTKTATPESEAKKEPTTSKGANTVTIELLVLRKGENRGNEQIRTLQRLLKSMGYYKMDIDGSFGNGTKWAVEDFQAERGLEIDGIVGKNTWTELLKG
jgi:N-acetylmuramoyl-L-alanine amidase